MQWLSIFLSFACLVSLSAAQSIEEPFERGGENASELQSFWRGALALDDLLDPPPSPSAAEAASFLLRYMPTKDAKSLSADFLLENLHLALLARQEFEWCRTLPKEVFLNDVLPYATLDEERDSWRADFLERGREIVKDATSAADAAQALNREFFKEIKVHYSRERNRANQCPSESMAIGKASCTGLSILLVDACRAVGIPARIAGTPCWTTKQGNHTWVEILDQGTWKFTGADEYDAKGLNRAWFAGDAAQADGSQWQHAIWATSWKDTGAHWPMVWNLDSRQVAGINVTPRYLPAAAPGGSKAKRNEIGEQATLKPRITKDGKRIAVSVHLMDSGASIGNVLTHTEPKDFNDIAALKIPVGEAYLLKLTFGKETKAVPVEAQTPGETIVEWSWDDLPTIKQIRSSGLSALASWAAVPASIRSARLPEVMTKGALASGDIQAAKNLFKTEVPETNEALQEITAAGKTMKLLEKRFGPKNTPAGGRSLYISMHGGGGAPKAVNDQQWQNQIRLYEPEEGIVVAPRAPTDTWNLWHQTHIDPLFDKLIQTYVETRGVNPDRVYLMGYSAGGDGAYQVAPRMADRFAAAAMMAGHPNEANPLGLRNLPFAIFCGGNDRAYKRNEVAAEWGEKLDDLQKADPEGYDHLVKIYKGLGHWMNGRDREALPWMAQKIRNPWPKTIVWYQDDVTHDRFYWLQREADTVKKGQTIKATVTGQRIDIESEDCSGTLTLYLSENLLDLDQDITIHHSGSEVFNGRVSRSVAAMVSSHSNRRDARMLPEAMVSIPLSE